jgi:hypothetical protein
MSAPLKIAARVEIDASQVPQGARAASAGLGSIGVAAKQTQTQLQQLIAASTGLHDAAANANLRNWTGALAAEGLSVDNLRAKYSPLSAVMQRYKETQVEIRTALAMGALSSDEYAAAMARERQATISSIDAIKGRNTALSQTSGNQRFQTANLAFQAQDIITTAPFMPWYTVALQQGPQVAAVLGSLEDKSAGLRAAFMSLISPWSLISIAAVAAISFAVQYFTSTEDAAEATNEELERQRELLQQVANTWGDAVPNLKAYVDQLARVKEASDLIGASNGLADQQWDAARTEVNKLRDDFLALQASLENTGASTTDLSDLVRVFNDAATAVDQGREDTAAFKSVLDTLNGTIRSTGSPLIDEFVTKFEALARSIASASKQAAILRSEGLTALAGGSSVQDILSRATFRDGDKIVQSDRFAPVNAPKPESRPLIELDGLPGSHKVDNAAKSTANAYRDLIKSADDRVAQMKLEAQLAGETGIAADTLRFKLDLLQESEDKGRSLSPKQVEAINSRVEAFKKYAEEATKAKLKADLLFDRDQLGRSGFDQQIAGQLRSSGLAIDFDSYEAGLIRTNLQMGYLRDTAGDFSSTFLNGLEQGKSAWAAFGDAGMSVLKKISDTLLNDVLNSIFQVQGAASGSGGGGILGFITGIFGGGASSDPWAGMRSVSKFDGGGYTGPGGRLEPRGIVHAGEVVFSQDDVARNGGVAAVEALRLGMRGYSGGGVVGVEPLMSRQQSMAQSAGNSGIGTLLIKLGLAADAEMNILPMIKDVVAQDAPGFAMQVVEDYRDRGLADDVLGVMDNPRARGNG